MRKRVLLSLLLSVLLCDSTMGAVARRTGRTQTNTNQQLQTKQTAARAATGARTAPRATTGSRTTSARSAKPTATTANNTPQKTVAARAGTTQKIINTGTSVASASQNVLIDKTCQEKYNGCMDSFCMLNNANGGRCVCSDRNDELNNALAEIEKTDELSYQMATVGVEQLEMGLDADAAIKMSANVVESLKAGEKNVTSTKSVKSRNLSFDAWDGATQTEQNIFAASSTSNDITDKTGDELYTAAMNICASQIPECKSSLESVQLLYAQQVKSDCLAFENTLKKRRAESNEKLQAAERALRDTALEQHQIQNKYDLGQCSAKFKECIQTTAGCGEDFSNCVVITVNNSNSTRSAANAIKTHTIEGEVHSVTIFAATYDALAAKRPMCEHVTKQCVDVADQVWDTFLRDSAAQIKASETIAENNGRQNCVADISNCFQKACKDNIDPSDPDGSYDMCLSRPETMLNVCKVPLNNCGIDTTRKGTAQKSDIWQFIIARLASVRVNECTNQIKSCLAAEDRCGKDYTNCIGLDMDTIVGMCPLDKLTACDSSDYGGNRDEKLAYIYDVAQGVLLNVDNQLLQACQNAVNTKMMEICGGVSTCLFGDSNEGLGRGSLQTTQADDGSYTISGTIDFNNFRFAHPENPATADYAATNKQKYAYKVSYGGNTGSGTTANRIDSVVADINSEVNRKISMLAMDPTINMCITGRNISQIVKGRNQEQRTAARFPNLLSSQANIIYDSLLTIARLNYTRDYAAELSNANSMSREYRNMMMCASMAELSGDFTPAAETRYGIIASDDWYVKLSGTSTKDQLDVLRSGASRTTPICTGARAADGKSCAGGDSFMIATEERTAVYEPGPQVCRITSRLYACTGYEAIYEGESSSYNVDMGADVSLGAGVAGLEGEVGVGGNLGFGQSKSKTTHKENFCSSFAEPTVSEQIINFSSGEAIFGNVTRGNMQNSYYNSSSVSNVTDNSWSVDLALSVSDDHSQHSTTTVEGDNATINANQTMTDNSSMVKKYDEKGKEKCKKGQVEDGNGGCRAMTDEEKCKAKGEGFTWSNGTCEDTKKLENAKNKCLQQVLTKKWDGKNCVDKNNEEKAAAQALYEQNQDNCAKKGQKYRIGKSGGECYGKLSKEEIDRRNKESLGNAIASAENDLKSKLTQPDMAVLSTKVAQDASSNFMNQHKSSLEAMENAAASGMSYEDYAKEEREKSLATENNAKKPVVSSEAATNSSSAGSGNSSSGSTGTSGGASSTQTSQADKRNPGELFDVPLGGACEIDGKKGIMTTVGCDISQTSQSKTNQNSNDAADTGLDLSTQKMVKAGAPCSEVGQLPHGVYTYVKGSDGLMHCVLTGCKDDKKYKFVSHLGGIRNNCVPVTAK